MTYESVELINTVVRKMIPIGKITYSIKYSLLQDLLQYIRCIFPFKIILVGDHDIAPGAHLFLVRLLKATY